MLVQRTFRFWRAFRWTRTTLIIDVLYAVAICAAWEILDWKWLGIPGFPVSVLGTAVAFYLGFKGNAAYGRLWEARKIWGGIVNTSRTWGTHVIGMVTDVDVDGTPSTPLDEVHRRLLYRHVAWLGTLRTRLRRRRPWSSLRF